MTLTTLLSARIRDLESRAAPLPDYQEELAEIDERRQQLHASIEGAKAAAYQLQLIGLHAEQVLNGTTTRVEITGGEEPLDEPTPEHEDAPKVPDVELPEPVVVDTAPAEPEPEPNEPEAAQADPPNRRQQVLAYIGEHPNLSARELSDMTGMQLSTASGTLVYLQGAGLLVHDGGRPQRYRVAAANAPEPEAEVQPDPPAELTDDQSHLLAIFTEGGLYNESILQIRTKWPATRVFRALQAIRMLGLVEKRHSSYVIVHQEQRATA